MELKKDNEIVIKQVLKNNSEVKFIEFFSPSDSRNIIMNADRFCEVFGYTIRELEEMR